MKKKQDTKKGYRPNVYGIMSPCKDCPKRYLGCHDRCNLYLDYKKRQQELNQKATNIKLSESENWWY